MVTIRRYRNNRKLYDTARSRYVTLDQVAALVRRGEPLRVVDSESGDDLTTATLAQILFESERLRARLDPDVLAELIRGGTRRSHPRGAREASLPKAARQRLRVLLERFAVDLPLSRQLAALGDRVAALEADLSRVERGGRSRSATSRR